MSNRLSGKKALITAAGQGIGRASAIAFAREGAKVYATDINGPALESLQKECYCETHLLDVTKPQEIQAIHGLTGRIDVLFNVSGFVHSGTILESTEAEWEMAMGLNVMSHYRLIKTYMPQMIEACSGSIINVASVVGSIKGAPNRFIYGMTKAALIGLTKSVAADYVNLGIRCNAICPGTVDTPSLDKRIEVQAQATKKTTQEVRSMFVGRQPLGRLGTAAEIAALAVYLASDESVFTTGTTQIIDGGWSI